MASVYYPDMRVPSDNKLHYISTMVTIEIQQYYDATESREIRSDLLFAVDLVDGHKVAIDCGCGAGADIEYLLGEGFKVYGFDIEDESISRCVKRFGGNENVNLSKDTFSSFEYPQASLVVADASLFFCPKSEFENAWTKIYGCLYPEGVFCGSFLGPEDTMASDDYDGQAFWKDVLVFDEKKVRRLFGGYEIVRFAEHKTSGLTPQGVLHDWHIFSVVAKKSDKSGKKNAQTTRTSSL